MNRHPRPPRSGPVRPAYPPRPSRPRVTVDRDAGLADRLEALDGRPFAAYRTLRGEHALDEFRLVLDQVPGDPATGPARARIRLPLSNAGIPAAYGSDPVARLACEDFLARAAARAAETLLAPEGHAAPGSGRIVVERPGPAIVERTSCRVLDGFAELRVALDLPAWERTVRGRHARALLTEALPRFARAALLLGSSRREELEQHHRTVVEHREIREALRGRGLVAFVPDGAQLEGLRERCRAPDGRAVEFHVGGRTIRGLGIPGGVTLLVGGPRSGAPEVVRAIAAGTEPRPAGTPGHGVVAAEGAVEVAAEGGAESQRERLRRALEGGARVLLLDEDRSAPAFLGRDPRLGRLLADQPVAGWTFADIARDLDRTRGVASIVAAEATGELLGASDVVFVAMDGGIEDATEAARRGTAGSPTSRRFEPLESRSVTILSSPTGEDRRAELAGASSLRVGGARVTLPAFEPPLDDARRRGLAYALARAAALGAEPIGVAELIDTLERELDAGALDTWGERRGDLARPPRSAIVEALYRLPSARFQATRLERPSPPGGRP
ncbi:MAG TPA: ABC-ATPase domain-containing protein [Candidatus Polarisedimenticolaceae bacterium]